MLLFREEERRKRNYNNKESPDETKTTDFNNNNDNSFPGWSVLAAVSFCGKPVEQLPAAQTDPELSGDSLSKRRGWRDRLRCRVGESEGLQ